MHDNTPVARALVAINAGDGKSDRVTATDDDGRFAFAGLPDGRYLVTASKAGWVTSYYGSARPGRPPGVRVALENGSRATIDIPMVPGSVISVRLVDDNGQPMARMWPWLLEYRMVGDRKLLARTSMPYDVGNFERSTDDRGELRLFGLPPGTYYLVVMPSSPGPNTRLTTSDEVRWAMQPPGAATATTPALGPIAGYAPMYYPGTPDPSAAQPIVVGPGEVRDGLTFRVGFVSVGRVSGMARRNDGSPAAGASIVLDPREAKVSLEGGSGTRATADKDGRFVLQNVPPGDYRITARLRPNPGVAGDRAGSAPATDNPPTLFWGQTTVVVSGQDVDGLGIALAPASGMTGRIIFKGKTLKPPADLTSIRLSFTSVDATAAASVGAGSLAEVRQAAVAADGTFRVEQLTPDRYLVTASWTGMRTTDGATGWWLTTIRVGARDLGDEPITVQANTDVRDVALTFSDRVGTIDGVLADEAGRPAPEYFVIAFPADRASWTSTSRRALLPVRPGTDGRYKFSGVLAGDYYLAVVTSIDPAEAFDPAFLETVLPSAIKITIAAGEAKRQDLRIGR